MSECSLLNSLINNLPFELHLPGYNYCGLGTKLQERISRGDKGINKLDEYCKDHDIAYSLSTSLKDRHKADLILLKMAKKRATALDASVDEKIAANLVNKSMLAKVANGSGLDVVKKRFKPKMKATIKKSLKNIISHTKKAVKNLKPKCKKMAIELAIATAKELASNYPIKLPRIIPLPKSGGFLPLIPIFAGLSAAGSLAGGAAGIVKVINDIKIAKKRLAELERHNEKMETVCIGKGLNLKPHKNGLGVYIANKEKN